MKCWNYHLTSRCPLPSVIPTDNAKLTTRVGSMMDSEDQSSRSLGNLRRLPGFTAIQLSDTSPYPHIRCSRWGGSGPVCFIISGSCMDGHTYKTQNERLIPSVMCSHGYIAASNTVAKMRAALIVGVYPSREMTMHGSAPCLVTFALR